MYSETIKEEKEKQKKFMQEIMKRAVFDSTNLLEEFNTTWNGIIINSKDKKSNEKLIFFIEQIQKRTSLKITNDYVKVISCGEMPMGAGAGFDFKEKTIKISEGFIKKNDKLKFTAFIHEFCHALDEKHNMWIEFVDLYKKYLSKLDINLIEDDSNPHKLYADFNEEQFIEASKGNMELYKVLSIKEFTAVALQNIFDNMFISEEDIENKAKEVIKKHLNL